MSANIEVTFCPLAQFGNGRWRTDKAKIQLGFIHRRLTGVTFRKELQDNTPAKISRQRDMRLQRDTLARGARQQIAQSRNSRIAPICADQGPRRKPFAVSSFYFPILAVSQCCDRCALSDVRVEFAGALQQQIVEKAAFHGQFAIVAGRKIDNDFMAVDCDELD